MRPRLIGERFKEKSIPLGMLRDFAALEKMIIAVAENEFLKDHPNQKKSSHGFTKNTELTLTGIEGGSAIPMISLSSPVKLFPWEDQKYFERALDLIVSTIQSAAKEGKITVHFPEKFLAYFKQIGRSLRAEEVMELSDSNRTTIAKLTRKIRERLIHASTLAKEVAKETTIRGLIPEADQDNMRFELQLPDGKKVEAPITPQYRNTILEVFNNYQTNKKVLIQGAGVMSRAGKLIRLNAIEHINILDPLDIGSRFDELRLLKDGWLEGEGKAPSKEGLDWLEEALNLYCPDEIELPHLYPTPEGGIRAEWSNNQWDLSLDIHLIYKHGTWHGLNLETEDEETNTLRLGNNEDWTWLIKELNEKLGRVA